ncbi:MAG: hypothetical protein H6645_07270 [Caldilineaceae bacterium]|nr:hypothetical protein [Caldilineaceae bacterium]
MPLVYTIVITNTSNQVLTTLPLPIRTMPPISFDSVASANPAPDDKSDDGQLNWRSDGCIGDLAPGSSMQVVVHFTALQKPAAPWIAMGMPARLATPPP